MNTTFYSLDFRDLREEVWVLVGVQGEAPSPRLPMFFGIYDRRERRPWPEYEDLVCPKCGKLDALAALQRGIPRHVKGPSRRVDAAESSDYQLLVSTRSRKLLEKLAGEDLLFFPLPGDRRYSVTYPKLVFPLPAKGKVYGPKEPARPGEAFQVRSRRCGACGRPKSSTFKEKWFIPPQDMTVGAAWVEPGGPTNTFSWLCSKPVADAIRKAKLTGWWIKRKELDAGNC